MANPDRAIVQSRYRARRSGTVIDSSVFMRIGEPRYHRRHRETDAFCRNESVTLYGDIADTRALPPPPAENLVSTSDRRHDRPKATDLTTNRLAPPPFVAFGLSAPCLVE